jgi:hypothetical protein
MEEWAVVQPVVGGGVARRPPQPWVTEVSWGGRGSLGRQRLEGGGGGTRRKKVGSHATPIVQPVV